MVAVVGNRSRDAGVRRLGDSHLQVLAPGHSGTILAPRVLVVLVIVFVRVFGEHGIFQVGQLPAARRMLAGDCGSVWFCFEEGNKLCLKGKARAVGTHPATQNQPELGQIMGIGSPPSGKIEDHVDGEKNTRTRFEVH